MQTFWVSVATLIRRRYLWVLAASALATVVLAFGITRLEFKTSQDTIVPSGSQTYRDNARYEEQFGGEPILMLFSGSDIRDLFVEPNLSELRALERELVDSGVYHAVIGPYGTLEFARDQIPVAAELAPAALVRLQDEASADARAAAAAEGAPAEEQARAAEEARAAATEAFAERNTADATRLAAAGAQTLDNPAFVDFLVFDEAGAVRPEFEGMFPDQQHALMVVRIPGNLTIDQQGEAAQRAIDIAGAHEFQGFDVLPTGPPLLLKEINDTMRESMATMAALAISIMIVVLFLVFRARWRLLSLGVVLVGSVWAFGLMGYAGIPLTMVTISGLPILIGLGVDFSIQMHSRYEEESSPANGLRMAFTKLGPAFMIAVVAATVGFLALHISEVPMIRDFGSMLAVGVVILAIAGIIIPASLLYWRDKGAEAAPAVGRNRIEVERLVRVLTASADRRLLPVVAIGVAFVVIGLVADQRITIQTDPERFVPQDSPVLQDLYTVRDVAGSSSQVDLMIEADDVTDDAVLAWMGDYSSRQLEAHPTELMRAESVTTIVERITGAPATEGDVEAILALPAAREIQRSFISQDRTMAHVIFAIGPISLDEQRALVDKMQADLEDAPPSVVVTPTGLAVIGGEAVDALNANRSLMVYAALGAVLVWLLLAYRNLVKMVLPVLPILIALGCSSVAIYLLGIELNPLTAVSGPLIIATCTEFSVLLMSRYFEERELGRLPREAINVSSVRIGRAIAASGLTTIGGFGVLSFSGFPLLETFGVITAMNVGIALLSTLIVLPPLLVWADEETGLVPAAEPERLGTAK